MTERYDSAAARHYAAFRPPLHGLILERVIHLDESFHTGLDIGCGTGYSAVALAKYCDRVYGLDLSRAMLDVAQKHPRVSYLHGAGDELSQRPLRGIDVVSFAGSLFYTKTDKLRDELLRVCRPGAKVLVYDFEVLLNAVLAEVGAGCDSVVSDYDYSVDLSDWSEFAADGSGSERLRLCVTAEEIAHLILSDSTRYDALRKRFPVFDLFELLVGRLTGGSNQIALHADMFFSRYVVLRQTTTQR